MLITDPGVPAARWRRPISRVQLNVPLRVMSTTVRQALGDMSSAGTPKLAAALLTSTPGSPKAASAASKAAATDAGSRDVAHRGGHVRAQVLHGGPSRLQVLGGAAGDHDGRPEPGELGGDGLAQAGAAPGHQHGLAVEGPPVAARSPPPAAAPAGRDAQRSRRGKASSAPRVAGGSGPRPGRPASPRSRRCG